MMKLVTQEKVGQCGPACVAMVLCLPLKRVLEWFPHCEHIGATDDNMVAILNENGYPAVSSTSIPYDNTGLIAVPAILTVPSLNIPGLLHYIVWDVSTLQYLDPTYGRLKYPDDAPIVDGKQIVSWTSGILIWI